jgi:hypothetical protein
MKIKSNKVNVSDLIPEIKSKFDVIEKACKSVEGEKYEPTITSGKDGKHMKGSKHYIGDAIGLRCSDMKDVKATTAAIDKALGVDYDVVFEVKLVNEVTLFTIFKP